VVSENGKRQERGGRGVARGNGPQVQIVDEECYEEENYGAAQTVIVKEDCAAQAAVATFLRGGYS